MVLDYLVQTCKENLRNWFYGIVSHCCSSGYYFRLHFRYHFWLHFRVLLPAALLGLLLIALPDSTSGCSSGYYYRLHFRYFFRLHFRVLLQSGRGIAMHYLCETSCPLRTVHCPKSPIKTYFLFDSEILFRTEITAKTREHVFHAFNRDFRAVVFQLDWPRDGRPICHRANDLDDQVTPYVWSSHPLTTIGGCSEKSIRNLDGHSVPQSGETLCPHQRGVTWARSSHPLGGDLIILEAQNRGVTWSCSSHPSRGVMISWPLVRSRLY